jgi:hypothetical protein
MHSMPLDLIFSIKYIYDESFQPCLYASNGSESFLHS